MSARLRTGSFGRMKAGACMNLTFCRVGLDARVVFARRHLVGKSKPWDDMGINGKLWSDTEYLVHRPSETHNIVGEHAMK
jgi:hypothetical protein